MDNVKRKKSEDRSEDEKYTSRTQANGIKSKRIKHNEGCFDELSKPPSPKHPKDITHSNAYDQVLDTSEDKNHIFDNTDFGNNPREMCFGSSLNKDLSHTSYLKDDKIGKVVASDHEKVVYADHVVKSNSTKKDVHEISFPHTDDFFKIGFEKDSCLEKFTTEITAFEESLYKDFVDFVPEAERVAPLTSAGGRVTTDFRLGNISLKSEEEIQLNSQTFYPKNIPERITRVNLGSSNIYGMETFPRGKLIIINVEVFRKSSGLSENPRKGTDKDAAGLQQLFLDLGFIVERHDNPTTSEIKDVLSAAANEDYSNLSCFACALLSHGKEGLIYGTDGPVNIIDLTSLFRTKELAGKPKIIFLQACRGAKYMESYNFVEGPRATANRSVPDLPVGFDFLFCCSTVEGYYAWRHKERGSWFIQILIKVFRKFAHQMDMMRMLTFVNLFIARQKSQTDTVASSDKRQIGSIISQLRHELFFSPPYGPLQSKHGV